MAIIKTHPVEKIINGNKVRTSESAIVSEKKYTTNGEYAIVIRDVPHCDLFLNSSTTDKIKIKAMTEILIKPDKGRIDEEWDEIQLDRGACIELVNINQGWYILSSDGVKLW
jgi:hypothetical protein